MSSDRTESEVGHRESEEAAVSALTSLVSSTNKADNDEEDFEIPQRFTKSGRKRAVPFPMKLMKVLSNKDFEDIISWTPSGKAFSILKPKQFVADILPDHFKSAKYSSFTRKLHRWGFMRHYRGDESGAFYHPDFQRDRLDLVEQMSCYKADPPKAPAACKASQPLGPVKTPTPAVQAEATSAVPSKAPVAQRDLPTPQPAEIMAQLQKQQQQLKTPDLAAERLNAAIEAEVTRRLQERIQMAALSRLAVMQQLGPTPPPQPPRQQWKVAAGSLQAQLLLLQQQKQRFGVDASCLGVSAGMPRMDNKGLDELPRTNIQGAKTA
mmetsp:Transcript_117818/g.175995  ORF Transcript_117818/g.175995 Transcript_117818/m.175995 type:complete len:323 (-) Transcript_117818:142-1110(-)|eukprot:CAMPEP_0117026128 /NCGR_PEP_ID=MMETSP0472-20121206/19237_1 /TAXON_ID=693140 ORGANISM="Tiarina fusus, Strain LIS" /NCGR_SAMPLE_ID=MMETSP0472 /ASSEMBLY_ACC=CAM_ASM_000603 /LENGTH=322 /DNA_ID=CAMNT_0004733045 /DNA_START=157 /DNA_END=1125 /DNA_ORIENTATION=+